MSHSPHHSHRKLMFAAIVLSPAILLSLASPAQASPAGDRLELVGFGSGNSGEFLNNKSLKPVTPTALDLTGTALAHTPIADYSSTDQGQTLVATTAGDVFGWGVAAGNDLLGLGGDGTKFQPIAVNFEGTALEGKKVVKVAVGNNTAYALSADGALAAWGDNTKGELGVGDLSTSTVPRDVKVAGTALEGEQVTDIFALQYGAFAQTASGKLLGWGSQPLVDPQGTTDHLTAIAPDFTGTALEGATLKDATSVETAGPADGSYSNVIALTTDGRTLSWGNAVRGGLGQGTLGATNVPLPTAIPALAGIKIERLAGTLDANMAAISTSGDLYTWGLNTRGQNGTATTTDSATPTQVPLPKPVVDISRTATHRVALLEDNSLWSWGLNSRGQLGTTASEGEVRSAPQLISTEGNALDGRTPVALLGGYSSTLVWTAATAVTITPVTISTPGAHASIEPGSDVTGTGEPGAHVTLTDADGTVLGSAPVSSEGTWTVTLPTGLLAGELKITATQDHDSSTATVSVTVVATSSATTAANAGTAGDAEATGSEGSTGTTGDSDIAGATAQGGSTTAGDTGNGEEDLARTGASMWLPLGAALVLLTGGAVLAARRSRLA